MTQLRHEAVLRLKSWKAGDFPLRRGVTKQPRWPTLAEHVSNASTTEQRSRPAIKFKKKKGKWEGKSFAGNRGRENTGGGARIGRKSCGFSGVSGTMCEEERLCSCRAPWRRAGRLRANALWKCPGGKGWIGGGAQASSWYRRFDSRAEGKKRIQTVVVKPSSGRPSANVRSTWWQPRLVRAALIWDLVARSRRTWFNVRSLNRGEISGVMGETKKPWRVEKRLYHKCEHPLGFSVCLHRSVSISFVRPVSLPFCASACLFSLFSRCAFYPGHTYTRTRTHTQTSLPLSHTFWSSSSLFRDRGGKSGASTGRPSRRLAASKALAELVHEIRMKSRRYVARWSLQPINAQISAKDGSG